MGVKVAEAGRFCPNKRCKLYGQVNAGNWIRYGHGGNGVQRYRCKACGKVASERRGTLFYRKRTAEKDILETLALLADGVRISSLSRAKGHKEDTILAWLREAGQHAQELEVVLMKDYQVKRAQIDGLWTFVKNKGEKRVIRKAKRRAPSGAAR